MSSSTSHPMLTPHDDTVIAWQQACTQAADALRPQHDRERLAKALALAHEGAITLDDDGALVCQRQGCGEPLAVVLRAQRVCRLGAGQLPGNQGVVVWGQHGA